MSCGAAPAQRSMGRVFTFFQSPEDEAGMADPQIAMVMGLPVFNGEVKCSGRVPSVGKVTTWLATGTATAQGLDASPTSKSRGQDGA